MPRIAGVSAVWPRKVCIEGFVDEAASVPVILVRGTQRPVSSDPGLPQQNDHPFRQHPCSSSCPRAPPHSGNACTNISKRQGLGEAGVGLRVAGISVRARARV